MADVFISYKSERRPAVRHLATILNLYGYSVWYDYELEGGVTFDTQIERELKAAKSVVVLWCGRSRESHYVLEEAHIARERGILVPAWLERIELPFGFTRLDTVDLSVWNGSPRDRHLDALLTQVARKTGRTPHPNHTGLAAYEQQWRDLGAQPLRRFSLASRDSASIEAHELKAGAWAARRGLSYDRRLRANSDLPKPSSPPHSASDGPSAPRGPSTQQASLRSGGAPDVPRLQAERPLPELVYPRNPTSTPKMVDRAIGGVIIMIVAAVAGFVAYREHFSRQPFAARPHQLAANPLRPYRDQWRQSQPDVTGDIATHLLTARQEHLKDTWAGYERAELAFQRALIIDINDPAAIAGYVENSVRWRYARMSSDEVSALERATRYATALRPAHAAPYRASSTLAYYVGDLNGCRAGADDALARDPTDAQARLNRAECFVTANAPLSAKEAERAQQTLPQLRRAALVLGRAYATQGRYASAFRVLSDRLKVDPDTAVVLRALGDLSRALGKPSEARRYYERCLELDGDRQAAQLALAELALEQGETREAVNYYRAVAEDAPLYATRGARVYTGWARAEIERGRGRRAAQLAAKALLFAPRNPAALLARGEAAMMVGSATTAAEYAKRAESVRLGETSTLVLAARAMVAQEQFDAALTKIQEAAANVPHDPPTNGRCRRHLSSAGRISQAFALFRRAADIDPASVPARTQAGLWALNPDSMTEIIDQLRRSTRIARDASVAYAAIGMLQYHRQERNLASRAVEEALRLDDANTSALIYRAQLALDQKDRARARRLARKILAIDRGSALGYLLLARASALYGDANAAHQHYRAALQSDPDLLSAKVELAGLDLDTEAHADAVRRLQDAFLIAPDNLSTRRLLLKAGL